MKAKRKKRHFGAAAVVFLSVLLGASGLRTEAQTAKSAAAKAMTEEEKGELELAAARKNPLQLRQFLKRMPKGTNLHYHLVGGVYAKTFIRDAVDDGLCVETKEFALVKCGTPENPAGGQSNDNVVPARNAYNDQTLYDELVDSFR
jgi:adenosine deaminase